MKGGRATLVHLGLLAVAAVFAVLVWTRDKKPKALAQGDVTVWSGRPADVERITYEGKGKKASLEVKKDAAGSYLVGTFEKPATAPRGDAGADAAAPSTTVNIVSVGAGGKLLEALAPLKALRALGKIADDRAAEFGLAEPDGKLVVTLKGAPRTLVVGGPTPGGADRYVKDEGSGEVYALKGDVVRDLESADQRLMERDLHEWKDADVASAKITAGGKTRAVVRGGAEGKKFWADPTAADKNDETVGNWMTKLDRLKPTEYAPSPPEGREVVVRVDYSDAGRPLGFIEVAKVAGASGKSDWYVMSERTRSWGKVTATTAEQVDQDVGSVVK